MCLKRMNIQYESLSSTRSKYSNTSSRIVEKDSFEAFGLFLINRRLLQCPKSNRIKAYHPSALLEWSLVKLL